MTDSDYRDDYNWRRAERRRLQVERETRASRRAWLRLPLGAAGVVAGLLLFTRGLDARGGGIIQDSALATLLVGSAGWAILLGVLLVVGSLVWVIAPRIDQD